MSRKSSTSCSLHQYCQRWPWILDLIFGLHQLWLWLVDFLQLTPTAPLLAVKRRPSAAHTNVGRDNLWIADSKSNISSKWNNKTRKTRSCQIESQFPYWMSASNRILASSQITKLERPAAPKSNLKTKTKTPATCSYQIESLTCTSPPVVCDCDIMRIGRARGDWRKLDRESSNSIPNATWTYTNGAIFVQPTASQSDIKHEPPSSQPSAYTNVGSQSLTCSLHHCYYPHIVFILYPVTFSLNQRWLSTVDLQPTSTFAVRRRSPVAYTNIANVDRGLLTSCSLYQGYHLRATCSC